MSGYRKSLTVGPLDLDALQHVNNLRYLEWVLEIAAEHWEVLSGGEWDAEYHWVVRSHHIRYKQAAVLGDQLKLETRVVSVTGARSEREVTIRKAKDASEVAHCSTEWCLVRADSGSPVRIPAAMQDRLMPPS